MLTVATIGDFKSSIFCLPEDKISASKVTEFNPISFHIKLVTLKAAVRNKTFKQNCFTIELLNSNGRQMTRDTHSKSSFIELCMKPRWLSSLTNNNGISTKRLGDGRPPTPLLERDATENKKTLRRWQIAIRQFNGGTRFIIYG